jgi:hypothetical protein
MSKASLKRDYKQEILLACPFCIYCGGNRRATTIDHFPPKIIFDNKHRPKGLEYASCYKCNNAGKDREQITALLARSLDDLRGPFFEKDVRDLVRAIHNNYPHLIDELLPKKGKNIILVDNPRYITGYHALNIGPMMRSILYCFGAKLGFSLHYQLTKKIMPNEGLVAVRVITNHELFEGEIPYDLIGQLHIPRTLQQGQFNVDGQFNYSSGSNVTGSITVHYTSFRKSFAILVFCFVDANDSLGSGPIEIFTNQMIGDSL